MIYPARRNTTRGPLRFWALFAFLLITLCAGSALAGERMQKIQTVFKETTPQERAANQTELMAEKLNLDAATKETIHAINLDTTTKMGELFLAGDGKFSTLRKAKALSKEKDKALKEALTPEQYEAWGALKKEIRSKRESGETI